MRLMAVAVAAALAVCAVSGADAAPRKKRVVQTQRAVQTQPGPGGTYIMHRDETGRTRTKILVQKRSYLDGGTEVMPGDISTNQINLLTNRPSSGLGPNVITNPPGPIPDPFFLPGKFNPWPGFGY